MMTFDTFRLPPILSFDSIKFNDPIGIDFFLIFQLMKMPYYDGGLTLLFFRLRRDAPSKIIAGLIPLTGYNLF